MNNQTVFDQTEDEIFTRALSDEALELAAGTSKERADFTLANCTGLSECPG
jgi:hypothetical protein